METTEISLKLSFDRRQITVLLAFFLLAWHPGFLGSETLTLTTYYPAPYGGYVSILTTNQTLLARDSGNVGIGTQSPGNKLHVVSTAGNTSVDIRTNGRIMTGDASNNGGVWLSQAADGFVGNNGSNIGFWSSGAGWDTLQVVKSNGNVGIGTQSPTQRLHVSNGNLLITGNGTTTGNLTIQNGNINGLCSVVPYGFQNTSPCPNRMRAIAFYGTAGCNSGGLLFLGGNMQDPGRWRSHVEQNCSGNMLCCRISQW